jgi:hypothetical protein
MEPVTHNRPPDFDPPSSLRWSMRQRVAATSSMSQTFSRSERALHVDMVA